MKTFEQLRIVFFGTPDFAVASLKALADAGASIVAVVTAPDKPAGRGMQLQASPVKQFATERSLPVLQPPNMKSPEFLEQLKELNADLQVVVAFRMMPEAVWNMPPMGTINVHGSLLPQYRGAAPINRAIMNGEPVTGVTTFKLKHQIDTGNILLQQSVPILPDDNAGTMHDKLMEAGAQLLVTTVKGLATGTLSEISQDSVDEQLVKHAPKIFKEDTIIPWNRPGGEITNFVRGLSPYPAAISKLGDKMIKVYGATFTAGDHAVVPGAFETDNNSFLRFAVKDGWVYIHELQQEGKKRMSIADFLRGFRA